jgi:hypothetical protein
VRTQSCVWPQRNVCSVRCALSPARNWRTPSDMSFGASRWREKQHLSLRRRLGEGRLGCSAAVGSYCVRSCRDGIQPLSGLWIPLTGAWSCGQHRPTRASAYSTLPRSNALIMGKSTKRQRGDKDLFAFVRFPRQRGERFSHPSSEIASGLLCSEMQETSIDIWRLRRVAQPVCT